MSVKQPMASQEKRYVLAIDQGTTSCRAIVFDCDGMPVSIAQKEHTQFFPQAGWVEHDAAEIWRTIRAVVASALSQAEVNSGHLAAVGVTNQRETVVAWDKTTGEPLCPAIVWQDTRSQEICDELAAESDLGVDRFRERTGLPLATYFSGPKMLWMMRNYDAVRQAAQDGRLLIGTTDSWVTWNLTGGVENGVHITDVTNASRTMLMNIHTCQWDNDICEQMGITPDCLPKIVPSSGVIGHGRSQGLLAGVPIAGVIGDQQAATFGQGCFEVGQAKNTYGTGCFMLMNTGTEPVSSAHGLLTTVAYQIEGEDPVYALEGSVAVAGSLVQWLRDNLKIISSSSEVQDLARTVDDNGGAYCVPAFSGLFAPYWRPDARGAIVGLTRFVNAGHIARAVEEATAHQSCDVLTAMEADSGVRLSELHVDGGMTHDALLMQIQADLAGIDVVRPQVTETTALGAAYAAGIAVGLWKGPEDVVAHWKEDERFSPQCTDAWRENERAQWAKAVNKTLNWVD
ncbi:glycerol kinase GlpK [Actinomyces vulturis]|uniref:glycerol kinase GlpK n=1 Tax=Actinomyces vulturis TaxID=1857645 RepID=UPI0009F19D70|nr:glycerol kinase GlpK [Actinomyces vulturis]